jgi:hypothetical protein
MRHAIWHAHAAPLRLASPSTNHFALHPGDGMTQMIDEKRSGARDAKATMAPHSGDAQFLRYTDTDIKQARPDMKVLMRIPKIRPADDSVEPLILRLQLRPYLSDLYLPPDPATPQFQGGAKVTVCVYEARQVLRR